MTRRRLSVVAARRHSSLPGTCHREPRNRSSKRRVHRPVCGIQETADGKGRRRVAARNVRAADPQGPEPWPHARVGCLRAYRATLGRGLRRPAGRGLSRAATPAATRLGHCGVARDRRGAPRTLLPAHRDRTRTTRRRDVVVATRLGRRRSRPARRYAGELMSWLHGLGHWVAALVRRDARDRELAEEIRFHLDMEAAKQRARGHDPTTARAVAIARFGNVTRVAEATRDARGKFFTEGYMHDLTWAARSLRKQPGFSTLALITLALGVGATTTAFTVLDTVLLRPLPYEEAGRLVFLRERTAEGQLRPPSYPNFSDWRDQAKSFSGVVSTAFAPPATVSVGAGADPVRATTVGVSRQFFKVLGVRPLVGREFTDSENAVGGGEGVMVSYTFWRDQMGQRTPLGTIRFGGDVVPVIGVLPAGFRFIDEADLYFAHERGPGTIRSAHNYRVVARLAPNATLASARAEMTTISRTLVATYGDETEAADVDVVALRDYLVGDYRVMLVVVFGAAAMVLLIACTNLVSAQLARGLARQREVAVRGALGASRGRLVRLLFVETGLLV